MSVRLSERGEGKLEVLNCAKVLGEYTINQCRSEKVFPKAQRWVMANRIINECLDAISAIKRANVVKLDINSICVRRMHQDEAYGHLEVMLTLLDLAYMTFGIPDKKIEYWTKLIVDTEIKLKAWMKSDKQQVS